MESTPEQAGNERGRTCDLFVYGSTPGGIAAAVEAARRGLAVVLACPKRHPGGMAASGLCTTDAVRRSLFGAFVLEFIGAVRQHYRDTLGEQHPDWRLCQDGWYYEPSVAEAVFRRFIEAEERIDWLPEHVLTAVTTASGQVHHADLTSPDGTHRRLMARTWIDGTYEGDLAALAGASFRVGREGREEYGESLAGIHYMNWRTGEPLAAAMVGEPSIAIQAFCARTVLTDDPVHRLPIDQPPSYDRHLQDILPLLDDFRSGRVRCFGDISMGARLPGRKLEINGHIEALTSINCPGVSWAYPEADRGQRRFLDKFHVDHAASLLYFLQHDRHVPDDLRREVQPYGLHDQEFRDHAHWPWQLYVRQGRRIHGRAVVTQHTFIADPKTGRTPRVARPIALGEHSFDIHPCHDRRYALDGFMEGVLWYPRKSTGPAQPGQVPYEALLPERIDNLLVPVAISSSHVAMSVLRMEPLWMTTGQVAGAAAAAAHEQHLDVAAIDPEPLMRKLAPHLARW